VSAHEGTLSVVRKEGGSTFEQTVRLEPGRGREVRFEFRARPADSAGFRFDARSGQDADAVALALPLRMINLFGAERVGVPTHAPLRVGNSERDVSETKTCNRHDSSFASRCRITAL
jgi:hypothetical protein